MDLKETNHFKLLGVCGVGETRPILERVIRILGHVFWIPRILIVLKDLVEARESLLRKESNAPDETGDAACRKGASREAHEDDVVTVGVVVRQEGVRFTAVLGQAKAGTSTSHAVPEAGSGPDAGLIVDDLRHVAAIGLGANGPADAGHVRRCL